MRVAGVVLIVSLGGLPGLPPNSEWTSVTRSQADEDAELGGSHQESAITLSYSHSPIAQGAPALSVDLGGKCDFPMKVFLKVTLSRLSNRADRTLHIEERRLVLKSVLVRPVGGEYSLTLRVPGPGNYVIAAAPELSDHPTKEDKLAFEKQLKVKAEWSFILKLWAPQVLESLRRELSDVRAFVGHANGILAQLDVASRTERNWLEVKERLTEEVGRLGRDVVTSRIKAYFPGAADELQVVVGTVVRHLPRVAFSEGMYFGVLGEDGGALMTHRGEAFSWTTVQRYLQDCQELAEREYLLWVVTILTEHSGANAEALALSMASEREDQFARKCASMIRDGLFRDLKEAERRIRTPRIDSK